MAETQGTAAAQDTSPSLDAFVGDIMGDFLTAEPDSDAGAPPASTPETPASEGTQPASEQPKAADAETVPDPNAQIPESDPLEGSAPMAYVVNGESRTFEGITKLKDGGAIVDPEAVALLERRLGERDHLFETSRAQQEQLEHFGKLTEWQVRDANGQTRTLTGREGVEAQRLAMGNAIVEAQILRAVLSDPRQLSLILMADRDEQGNLTNFALNPDALETLKTRIENAQLKGAQAVRANMARYGATQAPAAQASTLDAKAQAPAIIEYVLQAPEARGITLSDADKKWAASVVPRYVRPATVDDQRKSPMLKVGEPMVDADFVELLKDRAQIRASTSTAVTAASAAAKQNAANLAAAKTGAKPNGAKPTIPPPTSPTSADTHAEREKEEDDAFFGQLKAAAGVMRHASKI